MSPEVIAKLAILRQKANEGNLSVEEMKEAVILMRGDRKAIASAPTGSTSTRRAKAKAEIKSADEMLDELGKI